MLGLIKILNSLRMKRIRIAEELWPADGLPNKVHIRDADDKSDAGELSFPYFITQSGELYKLNAASADLCSALVGARKGRVYTKSVLRVNDIGEAAAAITLSGSDGRYLPIETAVR